MRYGTRGRARPGSPAFESVNRKEDQKFRFSPGFKSVQLRKAAIDTNAQEWSCFVNPIQSPGVPSTD